jgi:ABC-type transport system substrate-binding protein
LQKDAIGSGQWVLASHDNGANIQLKKFQNFRQFSGTKPTTGQPFLDGINNKSIADDVAALAAFRRAYDTCHLHEQTEADD